MGDNEHPAIAEARGVRRRIDRLLDEYTGLAERMREFENAFLTYVLLPGYQLQLAVKKREFLEKEHARIAQNIRQRAYASKEEIDEDIRQAIGHSEVQFSGRELADRDREGVAPSPVAGLDPGAPDLDLTEEQKSAITGEFKRKVIPKVHADTSDAPYEEFQAVLEAYKKKDFLLMRAFIIRYAGDLARRKTETEEDFVGRIVGIAAGDREVLEKLEARIDGLKRNMTAQELESRDEVLRQLKSQNREIQKAIYREAEELNRVRSRLEDLVKTAFAIH